MDRRVTNSGAKKEHGHAEPEDADPLETKERAVFSRAAWAWDDTRGPKDAQVGLQMLAAALAAVFLGGDPLLPSKGSDDAGACAPLRLFKERAEGGE